MLHKLKTTHKADELTSELVARERHLNVEEIVAEEARERIRSSLTPQARQLKENQEAGKSLITASIWRN